MANLRDSGWTARMHGCIRAVHQSLLYSPLMFSKITAVIMLADRLRGYTDWSWYLLFIYCVSHSFLFVFGNLHVNFFATHWSPAVSINQASPRSDVTNEFWYVHWPKLWSSQQIPPCPCAESRLVITSTASLAVLLLSNASLQGIMKSNKPSI